MQKMYQNTLLILIEFQKYKNRQIHNIITLLENIQTLR